MKKAWSRGEKWLWAAPLLFGVAAVAGKFGPGATRRAMGYPTELSATPGNGLTSLALSGDGRVLVAGEGINGRSKATTNTIYLWDAHTLKPLAPFQYPASRFVTLTYCVAISPDAKTLAWSNLASGFKFSDLKTKRTLWKETKGSAQDAAFSPDGKLVALGYGVRGIYEARTGKLVTSWNLKPNVSDGTFLFSPQGRYFASDGARLGWNQWLKAPNDSGGDIELRRVRDWKIERVLALPNTEKLAFSPDERLLIGIANYRISNSVSLDGSRLRCFEVSSGKLKWDLDAHRAGANPELRTLIDACFSPDGTTVAVLPFGHKVFLLDAKTGDITRTFAIPAAQEPTSHLPHALAFSPDGKRLFARGKDAVLVWDLS